MRIVVENLKRPQWIDLYENGNLICSIWGKGKIRYYGDDYMLCIKDANGLSVAFVHFKKGELVKMRRG